jgi:hypothetical protein
METSSAAPTPDQAAAALRQADAAASGIASGLQLPSYFHSSLGTATALQIATAAVGAAAHDAWGAATAAAGAVVWIAVGVLQVARFRAYNGARVRGLESRVVAGTANTVSTAYGLAFGGALWAAFAQTWWLVAVFSILGGVGYAVGGLQWWHHYQRDPAGNSRGDSALWLAVLGCAAVLGMVALVVGS